MEETVSRRLQMFFQNADGGQSVLTPKYFDDSYGTDVEKLQKWMDKFSALNVFYQADKENSLYIGKKTARLVETKITKLF